MERLLQNNQTRQSVRNLQRDVWCKAHCEDSDSSNYSLNEDIMSVPYELHITVDLEKSCRNDVVSFKEDCKILGVKPVVIDLQDKRGTLVLKDVMTSSRFTKNSDKEAVTLANELKDSLEGMGYCVVRFKLESYPFHRLAPQTPDDIMPSNCYFESHIPVKIYSEKDVSSLQQLLKTFGKKVHKSKNTFKVFEDHCVIMLTYRNADTYYSEFKEDVDKLCSDLTECGLEFGKIEVEFAV